MDANSSQKNYDHPGLKRFFEIYCVSDLVPAAEVMGVADWYESSLAEARLESQSYREVLETLSKEPGASHLIQKLLDKFPK